jgi:hypothetical protein
MYSESSSEWINVDRATHNLLFSKYFHTPYFKFSKKFEEILEVAIMNTTNM